MIKSGFNPRLPFRAAIRSLFRLTCCFGIAIASLSAVAASDQLSPDEQYIHIMTLIDRGDALRAAGQADAAKAKYRDALTNLVNLKARSPLYNPKTVNYRIDEVKARVDTRPALPEMSAPAAKPKANLEAAPSGSASKSGVKLIDAGAEPRTVLRLHVKPGDKQTAIMTVKMNMNMDMAGVPGATNGPRSINLPPMSLPMDVTIQSIAPNGDISYQALFEEPGVSADPGTPPQVSQGMKMALGKIKGMTCTGVISSRGVTKSVEIKAPADADPQLRQSIEQVKQSMHSLGVPMPEEAVGAGAKWESKMPVKSDGMNIDQTAEYQLVSAQGDNVNTTFTLTQDAANQKVQNPNMGGVQMNLQQYTGNGTGNVTTDLSKLVALQANMDMHISMESEITKGTNRIPLSMKMGMNITMEAR